MIEPDHHSLMSSCLSSVDCEGDPTWEGCSWDWTSLDA